MQLSNLPSMLERKDVQQNMFRVTLAEMAEDVGIATHYSSPTSPRLSHRDPTVFFKDISQNIQ